MVFNLNDLNKVISLKRDVHGNAIGISRLKAESLSDKNGKVTNEFGPTGRFDTDENGKLLFRGEPIGAGEFTFEDNLFLGENEVSKIGGSGSIEFYPDYPENSVTPDIKFENGTIQILNASNRLTTLADTSDYFAITNSDDNDIISTKEVLFTDFKSIELTDGGDAIPINGASNVYNTVFATINGTTIDTTGSSYPTADQITVADGGTATETVVTFAENANVSKNRIYLQPNDNRYIASVTSTTTNSFTVDFNQLSGFDGPKCEFNVAIFIDTPVTTTTINPPVA